MMPNFEKLSAAVAAEMIGAFRGDRLYTFAEILKSPVEYPHYDVRGCYRYRPPNFFECLTPLGRVRALNARIRQKREGAPVTYQMYAFTVRDFEQQQGLESSGAGAVNPRSIAFQWQDW